ncbi:aspartate aminotransferase [Campylobacter pinnipediorum subsp. pinnipediorum]|nr:aspartate aminotransferase [Campylobacter pinnipediorum subsp. pinnipediorum]
MFDEIRFNTIERLPNYIFAEANAITMAAIRNGQDIIDFFTGNPKSRTLQYIVDKFCENINKDKTHSYSVLAGIYKLKLAICNCHNRKYNANLDQETQAVIVSASKECFEATTNHGDVVVIPVPAYPIHTQAFLISCSNVVKMPLIYNEKYELDENKFFDGLISTIKNISPKPKYVVVSFLHNLTTVTVQKSFYERLVALSKQERFYIISDIATFDGYKTPILTNGCLAVSPKVGFGKAGGSYLRIAL